jgi:hypothetical protein
MKFNKVILTALALVAIAVPAIAQPDMTVNIGANAVLFRENGGIQVWTPDAEAVGGWSVALSLTADEAEAIQDEAADVLSEDEADVVADDSTDTVADESSDTVTDESSDVVEDFDVEFDKNGHAVILVSENEQVMVELLSNGQWQVSSGPDIEGKINVVILDSDFTFDREYTWGAFTELDITAN